MRFHYFSHLLLFLFFICKWSFGQDLLTNAAGRNHIYLNGPWSMIVDPYDQGEKNWKNPFWKEKTPAGRDDFYEYGFDSANSLRVPGDWNSQQTELKYYEGVVWYKRQFQYRKSKDKKSFLYFEGVTYRCHVYLNNQEIGEHEGGFTPFQFDVTDMIKDGDNSVYVKVDNRRGVEYIPAMNFDWWNYGGITRNVLLIETPAGYIKDYFVQLGKTSSENIQGWIQLGGKGGRKFIQLQIPELKLSYQLVTDDSGRAIVDVPARPVLWTPEQPRLYEIVLTTSTDTIREQIGFRKISVRGTEILLNDNPIFLRGINFHEEIPQRAGRAFSELDALQLLTWAKDLGCNFVRLTHYPQNEYIVRLAEKMGIMLWEEIPLWQGIEFTNPRVLEKAKSMLQAMISRDKNRCGIIIWSMSNETTPGIYRDRVIRSLASLARAMDSTRLITSALNHVAYRGDTISINDPICQSLDVVGVNEYLGWYKPWPAKPGNIKWENPYQKPLIMSEFGAEALFGHHGSADSAGNWNEEFQEQLYKDQIAMFIHIPFLRGVCPWILVDFRSPNRLNPLYQQGWNRKGLLSDQGERKKAWNIVREYYRR